MHRAWIGLLGAMALACGTGGARGGAADAQTRDTATVTDDATGDTEDATGDTGVDTESPPEGPTLWIVVEGTDEPVEVDDGLASQTPDPYSYGLQRLELLRGADDPSPVLIFDHAPADVSVDMHTSNTVAAVPMATLPEGSFTHFRIRLTELQATVSATFHDVPVVDELTTDVHILYALSDRPDADPPLSQGDARISVSVAGNEITVPQHFDVVYPEPAPGAWAESIDGNTVVTLTLAEPLEVSSEVEEDMTCGIRFFVKDTFRWQDQDQEGYQPGVWDVSLGTPPTPEPVIRMGANKYELWEQPESGSPEE